MAGDDPRNALFCPDCGDVVGSQGHHRNGSSECPVRENLKLSATKHCQEPECLKTLAKSKSGRCMICEHQCSQCFAAASYPIPPEVKAPSGIDPVTFEKKAARLRNAAHQLKQAEGGLASAKAWRTQCENTFVAAKSDLEKYAMDSVGPFERPEWF